jgi:2-polyprenyl-6-methoxyphenol hydroxylase-like FAD-dependent oxidoreductase
MTTPITRVAIVGTGVIGASWATAILARGMDVVASDPAPGAEEALRKTVDVQWPAMQQIGLSPAASTERLRFSASPEEEVADAASVIQFRDPTTNGRSRRLADVADPDRERLNWAGTAPTGQPREGPECVPMPPFHCEHEPSPP